MKSIAPNIFVNDLPATINFYTKLGFTVSDEVTTPEGEKVFALMTNGTVIFMFQTFASIEGKLPMVSVPGEDRFCCTSVSIIFVSIMMISRNR